MTGYREYTVEEAADFIDSVESALIICHVSPDGDAVGSAMALKDIFTNTGRTAKVVTPTPVPEKLRFIIGDHDTTYSEGEEDGYDAVITVDVASRNQLGPLSIIANKTDLMIDHHSNGEPYAPNLIDADASAAGEIIYRIYESLKETGSAVRSARTARYLFCAISADTGSFKYSNTSPETHLAAAELCEEIDTADDGGLTTSDLSRLLHDTLTEADIAVNELVTDRIRLYENGALAVCMLSAEDIKSKNLKDSDLSCAIDFARRYRGVIVAVIVRQKTDDPRVFKISARSSADIDVAEVCSLFGGGGHVRAAGATLIANTGKEAYAKVTAAFSEAVSAFAGPRGGEIIG
ncbi:MAG: bifunctional oligoribonuclease/PAP phosphatase NrnA [Clostridia bacterium]|nr:bifunctional oligoribonuclease/PAP phosphatase NrnA [Clostridia bacterium]